MFHCIRHIVDAIPLPVNGDLEDVTHRPETVAERCGWRSNRGWRAKHRGSRSAIANGLYDEQLAAERIRAAREAIDRTATAFVLKANGAAPWSLSRFLILLKISLRRAVVSVAERRRPSACTPAG